MNYPIPNCCPRCGSKNPAEGLKTRIDPRSTGTSLSRHNCRHAWHMPTPESEAVALVGAIDEMFAAEMPLPADVLAYDPLRVSTARYPE